MKVPCTGKGCPWCARGQHAKLPQPRRAKFYGMPVHSVEGANGTWLEGEEFCYPHGNKIRRAYCLCEDGVRRVCKCGIPDTYFTIPATCRIKGKASLTG